MPLHLPSLTRRQFISQTLAGGAAILASRAGWAADAAEERWALLSDTHIAADPAQVARNINMAQHLRTAVAEVKALAGSGVANVLVNGDCSLDHGEPGDYTTFLELTRPLREAGQAVHCLLGNHDERDVFWNAFREERGRPRAVEGKQVSIVESGLANWFLLDSLEVTKATPGRLGETQIEWLTKQLDARAGKPALVFVHHDLAPRADSKKTGLLDAEALLAVLQPRKQVKAVFYGHTHTWRYADLDGLHLVNLPAVAYPFKAEEVTGWVDCRLKKDGVRLEVSATEKANPMHGNVRELSWRA
jgi:predicted phosphodiesterase